MVESLGALKVQVVCLDTDWEAIIKEQIITSSVTADNNLRHLHLWLYRKKRELLFPQSCKLVFNTNYVKLDLPINCPSLEHFLR